MFARSTPSPRIKAAAIILLTVPWHVWAQTPEPSDSADRAAAPVAAAAAEAVTVYVPLNAKGQFHHYLLHMFSLESLFRAGASAGFDQALDSPHEWGQGALGYSRRFGDSYAQHVIQSASMYPLSAALGEDNRYFRSGLSGAGARLKYALLSTVMARHRDGSRHFSLSLVGSHAISAGVSRLYQPPSTNGPGSFADSFAVGLAGDAFFNVVREFFPHLLHSMPPVSADHGATTR